MFKPFSSKLHQPLLEEQTLNFWKLHRTFARTSQRGQGGAEYVFYEGPPTANSRPGVQHALVRAFQDIFPRYKLMRGYHVVRRGGWDTQGLPWGMYSLPVEMGVEQQLGFTGKVQIEAYGIERFNQLCRQAAFEYIQEWQRFSDRLGFWMDMREAYVTYTNEYIESVWWILKTFWERGLLYQDYKVGPYCPHCGTPLSDQEAAMGCTEVEAPSVFVRLPLVDEPGTALLVWTVDPWTLPGSVAVAAHPELAYATVERDLPEGGKERLILARPLVEKVFGTEPVRVVDTYKGRKLKGKRYKPLFTFLAPDKPAYFVVLQNAVTGGDGDIADGTGLVHIAPAFGAQDMQAAQEAGLPVLMTVKDDGTFIPEVRPWSGRFVKDAEPLIVRDLEVRGLLLRAETVRRPTAFCWRCDTPLLSYPRSTWYLRTGQFKERLLRLNHEINWVPRQIKSGRFGHWLEHSGDWALGRARYWGTPLPVWECQRCHHQLAVGSLAELSKLAGRDLSSGVAPQSGARQSADLHRPYVDQVTFPCPRCAGKADVKPGRKATHKPADPSPGLMKRVPDLVDAWFEAGSMPVAQWHFPFENRDTFRSQYPADFVCEPLDQVNGWFYALHAISALLFDSVAYKNAIGLGPLLDANGQKMSKSQGNLVDPWAVLNTHGADAFRWYLYSAAPPGQERRLSSELVGEVVRSFISPLWDTYSFFTGYSRLEKWSPADAAPSAGESRPLLDRWLLSELHSLVRQVTEALDDYDVTGATRPIQAFVADLSHWYLPRARRRFWKGPAEVDAHSAYATLYTVLVTLSKLLAPTMPFLSEALYQNLVRSVDLQAPDSVHLCDWPAGDPGQVDEALNSAMRLVMRLAALGHAARAQAGLKGHQPLAEAALVVSGPEEARAVEALADLLAEALNVKQVRLFGSAGEVVPVALDGAPFDIQPGEVDAHREPRHGLALASDGPYRAALQTGLTADLLQEGLGREFVRRVQELRRQAGCEIAGRIHLQVIATPDLAAALQDYRDDIMGELLALSFALHTTPVALPDGALVSEAWFDGQWMKVALAPAESGS